MPGAVFKRQVFWIDAALHLAFMVNDEWFRDWSIGDLIGVSVGKHTSATHTRRVEITISLSMFRASPQPASVSFIDAAKEVFMHAVNVMEHGRM